MIGAGQQIQKVPFFRVPPPIFFVSSPVPVPEVSIEEIPIPRFTPRVSSGQTVGRTAVALSLFAKAPVILIGIAIGVPMAYGLHRYFQSQSEDWDAWSRNIILDPKPLRDEMRMPGGAEVSRYFAPPVENQPVKWMLTAVIGDPPKEEPVIGDRIPNKIYDAAFERYNRLPQVQLKSEAERAINTWNNALVAAIKWAVAIGEVAELRKILEEKKNTLELGDRERALAAALRRIGENELAYQILPAYCRGEAVKGFMRVIRHRGRQAKDDGLQEPAGRFDPETETANDRLRRVRSTQLRPGRSPTAYDGKKSQK